MRDIPCPTCNGHLTAEPDKTFTCHQDHRVDPNTLDLGDDRLWLVARNGTLVQVATPAASLRRLIEADREYTRAPMEYEAELPPLLLLKEAAFDFITAMAVGLPYPSEVTVRGF
jgi:hypothetical protein